MVSGLGSRKSAILGAGGNTLDLAIAMLETETMTTDYVYFLISARMWPRALGLPELTTYHGYDLWFAGHRNGVAGLANPDTEDIND
ncbi:hypothetical protein F4778DRAFT_784657 [Xylariomycetidae sp. FL2044]|nr:hypothetical protein F4778DRAFT_784657 [Xylariomycetidae sp. FL2044]